MLPICRGCTSGHNNSLQLPLPDGVGLRRPVALLGDLVSHVSSVIAACACLVPQCCVMVSPSPVLIAVSRDDVTFTGIVISMPCAVVALHGQAVPAQRVRVALSGGLISLAGVGLRVVNSPRVVIEHLRHHEMHDPTSLSVS